MILRNDSECKKNCLSFLFLTKKLILIIYSYIGDSMKRKFKTKRKFNFKKLILLIIVVYLAYIIKNYTLNIKLINSNEKFIYTTLDNSNTYVYANKKNNNIISKISEYVGNNIFNNPIFFLKSQINYNNDKKEIENVSFLYEKNTLPLVYIYNSHQGENYGIKYLEEYNIIPNVLMASNMLKEKLESKNIKTVVEEENILEYMKENGLVFAKSYQASRVFLQNAINKYKSIKLFIDLHRDSVSNISTTVNIDGKDYAKVLFVVGLEHDNYEKNLEVTTKLNNLILNKYPTLTRGIMKKKGVGVNGIYNQDLNENIILLELGSNENNIDEINNTLDVLKDIIGEYLNEEK